MNNIEKLAQVADNIKWDIISDEAIERIFTCIEEGSEDEGTISDIAFHAMVNFFSPGFHFEEDGDGVTWSGMVGDKRSLVLCDPHDDNLKYWEIYEAWTSEDLGIVITSMEEKNNADG